MTCKHGNDEATCQRCVWLSPLMFWMYGLMLCASVVGMKQMPAHNAKEMDNKRQAQLIAECMKGYRPFPETPTSMEGEPNAH